MGEFGDSDDRPPIEVVAGSIGFWHGYHWKEHEGTTRKKWKIAHPAGKSVDFFEVEVTRTGGGCPKATGKKVTILYKSEGTERRFDIERKQLGSGNKFEPLLTSPVELDRHNTGLGLLFEKDGDIIGVDVDGDAINLNGATATRVVVQPRGPAGGKAEIKAFFKETVVPALIEAFREAVGPKRRGGDRPKAEPRRGGRAERGRRR